MTESIMQSDICLLYGAKSFHELSSSKRDNPKQTELFAIEATNEAGKICAVDFDGVKEKWYGMPEKKYTSRPCSVDALYCKEGEIYLIEFKTGGLSHLERKLYDSILMMVENFKVPVQHFREHGTYIVVATKWPPKNDCDVSISRSSQMMENSWEDTVLTHRSDLQGLPKLEGAVVTRVYGMTPREFELFVKDKRWT